MFGRIRREKERKAEEEKRRQEAAAAAEAATATASEESAAAQQEKLRQQQEQAYQLADEQKRRQEEQRITDRSDIEESVGREWEGMSEEKRRALQESANYQISQQAQWRNRQQQSEAGQRGFVGGDDALKMETARLATESQAQFARDITVMSEEEALYKAATALAMEEGRAAESLLRDQAFMDMLQSMADKAKEEVWDEYYAKYGAPA